MELGLRNAASLFGPPSSAQTVPDDAVEMVEEKLIDPFPGHPFLVLDDEDMDSLAESVSRIGVREPLLARRRDGGRWELLSGHRRLRAARRAGLERVPVVAVDMDDDEATVLMVDSNLTRTRLRVSEKARAMAMRHRALLHQGRADSSGDTRERMAEESGMSGTTVARLVRLDRLNDDLLHLIDDKRIPVRGALRLTDLNANAQDTIARALQADPGLHIGQHTADDIRRAALDDPDGFDERTVADLCRPVRLRAASMKISTAWIPEWVPATRMDEWVRRACELLAAQEARETEEQDGQE